MDEKLFVSEKDFLKEVEVLGFGKQERLSPEQIFDWYTKFVAKHRENTDSGLVGLSRSLLTDREMKLGFVTQQAANILITGWGVGTTQLSSELNAKIGELILPYFSSSSIAASTVIMGVTTITGEALGALADVKGKEKLARGIRLSLPVIGAITSAVYQYVAEFLLPGTFDVNDIVFGVLAVGTGYIGMRAMGNMIPKAVFNIRLKKEVKSFVDDQISMDDVIVEPLTIGHAS